MTSVDNMDTDMQQDLPATAAAGANTANGDDMDTQAAKLAAHRTQERQQQANRLATAYREETKVLMKELLKQQIGWREDLQASGVLVGVPSFQPPRGLTVRKRLSWRTAEREALKRLLFAHGVGKWKEIHTCLCGLLPGFKHGAGDVEDACWQLLGELQLLVASHDEHMYLGRLMEPVADRMPIYTPGPPFKLSAVSANFVRRLQLLEEFNMLMPAMQRSDAVVGYFRALAEGVPADGAPASWWDVECDVGLLAGLYRHGFNCYEEIRRDPDMVPAFQGYHARQYQQIPKAAAAADKAGADGHPQDGSKQSPPDGTEAASPAVASAHPSDDSWPSDDVLSQRVRQLFTLLAQAVVLAESQGLLMPLPGEGLSLTERLMQLPPSAGYVAAGASFFADDLWQEDEDASLEDLLCADEGSGSGSDWDAADAAYGRGRGRGRRGRGRGRGRVPQAQRLAAEAAAFGAMVSTTQPSVAAAAGEDDGDEGGGGRRRVHRPNSRYADSVLLPVAVGEGHHQGGKGGGHHAAAGGHSEAKGGDSAKKQRKDLLNLLLTWGAPALSSSTSSRRTSEDAAAAAAAPVDDGTAAADVYDWEGWGGRGEMTPSLLRASNKDLTAMLKGLTAEMEAVLSGASGAKPRNAHAPTCDCVVCTNRRRADERKKAAAAAAAAGGGGGAEGGDAAAAAAAGADGGGDEEEEEQQDEEEETAGAQDGPKQPAIKPETVTTATAPRLQERLDMLSTFRAALASLPPGWHSQAKSNAASKELPPWWSSQHDGALVEGVVRHGYGNWVAMCEDEDLPFKSAASHYGYDVDAMDAAAAAAAAKGAKGGKGAAAAVQPEWMPDSKALNKRVKSLVSVLKRMLSRHAAVQAGGAAGKTPSKAAGTSTGGGGGGGWKPSVQQQQQQGQMRLPPPNVAAAAQIAQLSMSLGTGPALVQALQAAAAQGNRALLAEYLRQQQASQLQLQQQQQEQQQGGSVLGKRGVAAAGLPDVGGGVRSMPGRPVTPPAGAAAAAAGAGGGVGMLSPEGAVAFARSLPLVQRDASGAAVLPLVLSKDLLVIKLGKVQPAHAAFHNPSYIFPAGYIATCTYPSAVSAGATTRYTTTIAEGQGGAALFVVVAADAPGKQWVATTAAGVWQQVHAQVQACQQQQGGLAVPPADGVTQMGMTHPLVSMLVQELPEASACQEFKPELSPAPAHVCAAIRQHQAAIKAAQQQQQQQVRAATAVPATAAAGGGGMPGALAPAAAAMQQQALAAQLQQQRMVQARQQPMAAVAANPQQQQQMLQMLQQRQAMQQQAVDVQGAAAVQQQLMLQQQLMARLSAAQQQQQQQGPPQ